MFNFLGKSDYTTKCTKILNKEDVRHQRIGYSEWCKGMKNSFSFLDSDLNKAIRKISKFI